MPASQWVATKGRRRRKNKDTAPSKTAPPSKTTRRKAPPRSKKAPPPSKKSASKTRARLVVAAALAAAAAAVAAAPRGRLLAEAEPPREVRLETPLKIPYADLAGQLSLLLEAGDPIVITDAPPPPCAGRGFEWLAEVGRDAADDFEEQKLSFPGTAADADAWAGLGGARPEFVRGPDLGARIAELSKEGRRLFAEIHLRDAEATAANLARVDALRDYLREVLGAAGVRDVTLEPGALARGGYPNAYPATDGTRTRAHVDRDLTSFVSFVCEGAKAWRVLPRKDLDAAYEKLMALPNDGDEPYWVEKMRETNATVAWGEYPAATGANSVTPPWPDIHDGYAFLPPEHPLAEARVFGHTLVPGEVLYVPSGTAHAATSVGDSLMIAHEHIDAGPCGSRQSADFWARACPERHDRITGLIDNGRTDYAHSAAMCDAFTTHLRGIADYHAEDCAAKGAAATLAVGFMPEAAPPKPAAAPVEDAVPAFAPAPAPPPGASPGA